VLDYEYICDRSAKFHKKILFITRVINIQILTTKYFSFQYTSHTAVRHSGVQPTEHVRQCTVNSWNIRLHHSSSVASQQSWPTQSTTRFGGSCRIMCIPQPRDVAQLKSRLIEEYGEHFHQVVIDEAVRQWRPRFRTSVRLRAHGGHFEHRL